MRHASWAAGAIAALGLTCLAVSAQAAPAGGLAGNLKPAAGDDTQIEQVRHRCYRHRGHWHCPSHGYRRYYGPGIYFNFGHRRHHHHRHYRHYHRHWR
ncbi:MAG TPA: hypothetical protein VG758_05295 [Hyphomicrobiaceae bacterium]|jgi:hypothetical protein|nr:hypothetical protein [Hyphomicrobiaceae bacterium]